MAEELLPLLTANSEDMRRYARPEPQHTERKPQRVRSSAACLRLGTYAPIPPEKTGEHTPPMTDKRADISNTARLTQEEEHPRPFSFIECLDGTAGAPRATASKSIFQLMMLAGMISVMVTFNGIRHAGLGFFFESHWLYPIAFCLAFTLRRLIADRLVSKAMPRIKAKGFRRNAAISALNVAIMGPIMGSTITVLLNGFDGLALQLAYAVPTSMLFAFCMNLLVVGPLVRYLYHTVLSPTTKTRIVNTLQRGATSWAGIFTN